MTILIYASKLSRHKATIFNVKSEKAWWRHDTFSALLAICAGNSPVPGEFPTQRPVTRSFGVFFDLRLNKRSSKQSWGWWFETLSHPLWRHRYDLIFFKSHGKLLIFIISRSIDWCLMSFISSVLQATYTQMHALSFFSSEICILKLSSSVRFFRNLMREIFLYI